MEKHTPKSSSSHIKKDNLKIINNKTERKTSLDKDNKYE